MDKKPTDQAEILARQLQEKLQRQRPRWVRWVPVLAFVLLLVVGALIWMLYPAAEQPRLTVTAFDALITPADPAAVRAHLDPVEQDAPARGLNGLESTFWVDAAPAALDDAPRASATSNPVGESTAKLEHANAPRTAFFVRHVSQNKKYETKDRAHIHTVIKETPLLLVEVEETLAELDPELWSKTNPIGITVRAGASHALKLVHEKQGYQIVYVAIENTPAKEYRRVRGWIELKTSPPESLPTGPVLGRVRYNGESVTEGRNKLLTQVRQRFTGPIVAVVRTAEAAEQYLAHDIRPVAMGAGDFPAGVTPLKAWGDLPAALNQP